MNTTDPTPARTQEAETAPTTGATFELPPIPESVTRLAVDMFAFNDGGQAVYLWNRHGYGGDNGEWGNLVGSLNIPDSVSADEVDDALRAAGWTCAPAVPYELPDLVDVLTFWKR